MKKMSMVLLVVLALLSAVAAHAQQSGLNTVRFSNETGFEIAFLFFSPGDSDSWGPDLLGAGDTLRDGARIEFFLHYPDECGTFDLMAIDTDGDSYLIWEYQICGGEPEDIELTLDAFNGPAPEMSFVELTLFNELPYQLLYLFLSPGDSEMWGVDYLSSAGVLTEGRSVSFLVPAAEDSVTYDLIGVDERSEIYSFAFDVDASEEEIAFPIEMTDLQEVSR